MICNQLQCVNWEALNTPDVDIAYKYFTDTLFRIIDNVAPLKTVHIPAHKRIKEPWFTPGLLKSSLRVSKLYKWSKDKNGTPESKAKYREYRNIFNKVKKAAKLKHYENQLTKLKNKMKMTSQILHEVTGGSNNKAGISTTIKSENRECNVPSDVADLFCQYFTSVGKTFAEKFLKESTILNITFQIGTILIFYGTYRSE